jgi:hypothetical protein
VRRRNYCINSGTNFLFQKLPPRNLPKLQLEEWIIFQSVELSLYFLLHTLTKFESLSGPSALHLKSEFRPDDKKSKARPYPCPGTTLPNDIAVVTGEGKA